MTDERTKRTRGECFFCGRRLTAGGMSRHLPDCRERQEVIERANQRPGDIEELYHLQIEDTASGDFWLHVEMRGSATMEDLDDYLRAIWLECCGHLSQFTPGGWRDVWGSEELPMRGQARDLLEPGTELTHVYDFGTTSYTTIKVRRMGRGNPLTSHPILLMARNDPPDDRCAVCGESASWLCIECLIEQDQWATFCDRHAEEHPHEEYGDPIPLVNSPRVGMCGYVGPAEPPY